MNSITKCETMITSTQNEPLCIKRGTRWCHSTPINFLPCVKIWVSRTSSGTWYWNITISYIGTYKQRWNSWTYLQWELSIGMLSKSRRNFDKRTSDTFDLWIHHRSKESETLSCIKQDKERTTSPNHKKIRVMEIQRRTAGSGVSSTKSLGTTRMHVTQSSYWWHR